MYLLLEYGIDRGIMTEHLESMLESVPGISTSIQVALIEAQPG